LTRVWLVSVCATVLFAGCRPCNENTWHLELVFDGEAAEAAWVSLAVSTSGESFTVETFRDGRSSKSVEVLFGKGYRQGQQAQVRGTAHDGNGRILAPRRPDRHARGRLPRLHAPLRQQRARHVDGEPDRCVARRHERAEAACALDTAGACGI
jgi:hypothetical protein